MAVDQTATSSARNLSENRIMPIASRLKVPPTHDDLFGQAAAEDTKDQRRGVTASYRRQEVAFSWSPQRRTDLVQKAKSRPVDDTGTEPPQQAIAVQRIAPQDARFQAKARRKGPVCNGRKSQQDQRVYSQCK